MHIDEHTPVQYHLDCPPGWTAGVVVCTQTWLLLSPDHCRRVRQLETSRLPLWYLRGRKREDKMEGREGKEGWRKGEVDGQDKIEGWRDRMARYGTNGATHDERKVWEMDWGRMERGRGWNVGWSLPSSLIPSLSHCHSLIPSFSHHHSLAHRNHNHYNPSQAYLASHPSPEETPQTNQSDEVVHETNDWGSDCVREINMHTNMHTHKCIPHSGKFLRGPICTVFAVDWQTMKIKPATVYDSAIVVHRIS